MCVIGSGNWNNGTTAGVFTANFNNVRGNSNYNVGCRADSATPRTLLLGDGGAKGDAFRCDGAAAGAALSAKSECLRLSGSESRMGEPIRRERQAQVLVAVECVA